MLAQHFSRVCCCVPRSYDAYHGYVVRRFKVPSRSGDLEFAEYSQATGLYRVNVSPCVPLLGAPGLSVVATYPMYEPRVMARTGKFSCVCRV